MHYICVYTGSNVGRRPEYQQAARSLGQELNARGLGLVYGGGRAGLMGIIADSVFTAGGEVIGVIPRDLFPREIANSQVTKLYEVGSMHERKALMAKYADGFIALPGGFGTFDEFFEMLTWSQLGIHQKPLGLLNIAHYFDPLLSLIEHAVTEGFVKDEHARMIITAEDPSDLLDAFTAYTPSNGNISKWSTIPEP
ncbi:TIGR00730 family Rossman fold protein [Dictyobacter arantiisoli]|uniref:Cytokinin riboside 5'-monophosphate phosphoribohydrolase n=1 Tax=Dictyobacter arantiisoli TaxID=2014874 RepID=A0A5A5T782_9CHLR|nr:TIGR00730 family Rossman fold protein [Dictyobacter arantiisoli]GCF07115.1 cytokinin riboside 5'-monophosphate phosphoribohydrolase [Dictyobacter arantiisoli]